MNAIYRLVAQTAPFFTPLSFTVLPAEAQTYVFGTASYSAPGLCSISTPPANAPIATADFNGDRIPDVAMLGTIQVDVWEIAHHQKH